MRAAPLPPCAASRSTCIRAKCSASSASSGSGKSVACLAIAGLLPDNAHVTGSIRLVGTEVVSADAETLRTLRGRDVGFVFQDPTTTLNPVLPVGRQIVEGQVALGRVAAGSARSRAVRALREVEIAAPETRVEQYPHQFSGGMRQRAVIAMAMSGQPKLIIADEPTTALDVTVQAQVLALLARRQAATGAAAILVTHDLGVVAEVAQRVAVMYGGRIVETGKRARYFRATAPSLYGGLAEERAATGSARQPARSNSRPAADTVGIAGGLLVPSALRPGSRAIPLRVGRSRRADHRERAHRRLPLRR